MLFFFRLLTDPLADTSLKTRHKQLRNSKAILFASLQMEITAHTLNCTELSSWFMVLKKQSMQCFTLRGK